MANPNIEIECESDISFWNMQGDTHAQHDMPKIITHAAFNYIKTEACVYLNIKKYEHEFNYGCIMRF